MPHETVNRLRLIGLRARRFAVIAALREHGGVVLRASHTLGLATPSYLYAEMRTHGIDPNDYRPGGRFVNGGPVMRVAELERWLDVCGCDCDDGEGSN